MFRVALRVLLVSPEAYSPDSGFYASGFAEETKVWSLVYKQARFRTQKWCKSFTIFYFSFSYICLPTSHWTNHGFCFPACTRVAYKTKGSRLPTPQVLRCRTLVANKGELETRVTGDEALGTTGRRKREMFSPFRLPLGATLHRERDGWVRGWAIYAAFFLGWLLWKWSMVRETQHTENRNCLIPHRRKSRMAIHTISRPVKFKALMSN